jgi:hypothetical protein
MNPEDPRWEKLVALARRARDERSEEAPYGFSTRVAALAMGAEGRLSVSLFERWSWRALAIAGMFAAASVATSYTSSPSAADDEFLFDDRAVAALFD